MGRPPRVDAPGSIFLVTTVTRHREPLLSDEAIAQVVFETVTAFRAEGELELHAWVFMPDHVHLVVQPQQGSLSDLMRRLKSLAWRGCRMKSGLEGRLWQEGFHDRTGWAGS